MAEHISICRGNEGGPHHWMIETPEGGRTVHAECLTCHDGRTYFSAGVEEEGDWRIKSKKHGREREEEEE